MRALQNRQSSHTIPGGVSTLPRQPFQTPLANPVVSSCPAILIGTSCHEPEPPDTTSLFLEPSIQSRRQVPAQSPMEQARSFRDSHSICNILASTQSGESHPGTCMSCHSHPICVDSSASPESHPMSIQKEQRCPCMRGTCGQLRADCVCTAGGLASAAPEFAGKAESSGL